MLKQVKQRLYGTALFAPYRFVRTWPQRRREATVRTHHSGLMLVGLDAYFDPSWETAERNFLSHELGSADVFVDVGANQGVYTCLAASCGVPTIAFEPDQQNASLLLGNLARNDLSAEVFALALSNAPGVLTLFGERDVASLVSGWTNRISDRKAFVAVNTLDNVLSGRFPNQRLLIKIDVEGAETDVLAGAHAMLARRPAPVWMIESLPVAIYGDYANMAYAALFELMETNGYRCAGLTSGRAITATDVRSWGGVLPPEERGGNFVFKKD